MKIEVLDTLFSVCKVESYDRVSPDTPFCFTGHTDEERSLVCPSDAVPDNAIARDDGWRAFRICGVLDFSLIGILSKISTVLADADIGIFAISTYNTDYVLVKGEKLASAIDALTDAGYELI